VNVESVLESGRHELLTVGTWLNVIGNVVTATSSSMHASASKASKESNAHVPPVVEATMIWSAGAVKLDKYDAAARNYQQSLPAG
jgi:hypothetical protein